MAPRMNDVATDLHDPPQFVIKNKLNPLPEEFKARIFEHYKEQLRALEAVCAKNTAFEACKSSAERMPRWTIEKADAEAGILEGHSSTKLMRFKDDWVIRLRDGDNSRVRIDMRSKSRLGKSDFGANAARISEFLADVKSTSAMPVEWVPLQRK